MSATLIVNPWASRVTPEVVAAVERELEAAGPLETVLTQRAGHATEIAAEASGRSERIYVLSGDGGFNEVVNGIGDDVAVGFIPGGGTSVLPRALGLPRDPVAGARALARSEEERLVTLGDPVRQWRVRLLVGQVLLAGVEPHERPALGRGPVPDGAQQHRELRLDGVEHRPLGHCTGHVHPDLALHLGHRPQVRRQHHPHRVAHGSVCTSTDRTAGRSRTIGVHESPESLDA